jgi:hypothetical protein
MSIRGLTRGSGCPQVLFSEIHNYCSFRRVYCKLSRVFRCSFCRAPQEDQQTQKINGGASVERGNIVSGWRGFNVSGCGSSLSGLVLGLSGDFGDEGSFGVGVGVHVWPVLLSQLAF